MDAVIRTPPEARWLHLNEESSRVCAEIQGTRCKPTVVLEMSTDSRSKNTTLTRSLHAWHHLHSKLQTLVHT